MDTVGKGILGGAGSGATLGTQILPGWGTVIGAVAGGVLGGISGSSEKKKQEEAMAAFNAIPAVDPNMLMFRDTLAREKKATESGFTTEFQVARDMIAQSEAGGLSVASELAMTNPQLALSMMQQAGAQSDLSVNKALATISTKGTAYSQMLGEVVAGISQRQLDINVLKASQGMATATASMKDFNANANAGMMNLMDSANIEGIKSLFNKPEQTIKV